MTTLASTGTSILNLNIVVYMSSPETLEYCHLFISLSIKQYLLRTYLPRVQYLWITFENLVFGYSPDREGKVNCSPNR